MHRTYATDFLARIRRNAQASSLLFRKVTRARSLALIMREHHEWHVLFGACFGRAWASGTNGIAQKNVRERIGGCDFLWTNACFFVGGVVDESQATAWTGVTSTSNSNCKTVHVVRI